MDILLEDWEDDYRNVSHKIKLMYKLVRVGSVKISKLIPDFETPFWTGFDWIEDGDALITYELPAEYHLINAGLTGTYKIVIKDISINCEKYPALSHDIDIIQDLFRYILRKIKNYLTTTLHDDEDIEISVRKKHEENDLFKNVVGESVDDKENDYDTLNKRVSTIFKAFKKGKVTIDISDVELYYRGSNTPTKYTLHYNIGDLYIFNIDESPFSPFSFKILIPSINVKCDENPDFNYNQIIKLRVADKVMDKFKHFRIGLTIAPSKFALLKGKYLIP